jgi:putative heme degradation protein
MRKMRHVIFDLDGLGCFCKGGLHIAEVTQHRARGANRSEQFVSEWGGAVGRVWTRIPSDVELGAPAQGCSGVLGDNRDTAPRLKVPR